MKNYELLGKRIIITGIEENTRIGPTRALHNQTLSFDLSQGFPLMTTKHVGHKSIIHETLWYLKGTTSIKYLKDNGVHVWDKFADSNDEIGKTYSYQFRNFNGVDQVKEVIRLLNAGDKNTNRRAIINLYNVSDLDEMSIPPCISLIQFNLFYFDDERMLDASIYQRSADFCLGVPYDIAEMALLTHIIAAYTNSKPNNMTIFYSNIHIYEPHVETLLDQLTEKSKALPVLYVDVEAVKQSEPEDLTIDMFKLEGIPEFRKKYRYELF
jgi:thymidylate synthase